MQGQKVQEYSIEIGPTGVPVARLGLVHNLITFVRAGCPKLHFLDGKWFDDGHNPVPLSQVPEAFQTEAASVPFKPSSRDAQVYITCNFCEWEGSSGDYAAHLTDAHIRTLKDTKVVGRETLAEATADTGETMQRVLAADVPDGDQYATDAEGYIIVKSDGSFRRKGGRPRSS